MGWTFFYLVVILKIPVAALFYIVWWAAREPAPPEPAPRPREPERRDRHPHRPFPRVPRRGPHGDALPPPPPRVRPVVARARRVER